jgi:hypothetical protein
MRFDRPAVSTMIVAVLVVIIVAIAGAAAYLALSSKTVPQLSKLPL